MARGIGREAGILEKKQKGFNGFNEGEKKPDNVKVSKQENKWNSYIILGIV